MERAARSIGQCHRAQRFDQRVSILGLWRHSTAFGIDIAAGSQRSLCRS
jgi:hypothetical protein